MPSKKTPSAGTATLSGPEFPTLLTTAEVANVLRCTRQTVILMIEVGKLRAVRLGKHFRVFQSDLTEMLSKK